MTKEKVIGFLQEMAEYFRECRSNASFASKAENHFWELQNAANEAVELLKEQEPMEPIYQERSEEHVCQKCGRIVWKDDGYCSKCGQRIKWK